MIRETKAHRLRRTARARSRRTSWRAPTESSLRSNLRRRPLRPPRLRSHPRRRTGATTLSTTVVVGLTEPSDIEERLARAASEIRSATALLFTSGTGIGVDAGIPDYRDPEGFWEAHPAYKERGLRFEDLARPALFERDPAVAWGFFGRRLNAARLARPHEGLATLVRWRDAASEGAFVATCSVEGFFETAGFPPDGIVDCYGRLDRLQCSRKCGVGLFPVDNAAFVVDEVSLLAQEPFPACPACGALARPNVLLFGDLAWDRSRLVDQERRLLEWLNHARQKRGRHFVVIECGDVPPISTVRSLALKVVADLGAIFVSIKPRGGAAPDDAIVLPLGVRDALLRIDRYLRAK
jgi:NAD-dependent SIR2 family protein deacetylase